MTVTAKRGAAEIGGVLLATLAAASPAEAAISSVFDDRVACAPQGAIRFCGGPLTTVPSFDGVPIDVNVALPPEPARGPDGPYPLVMVFRGLGSSKAGIDSAMGAWAELGYAAFSMSDRGLGDSCGESSPTRFMRACLRGSSRLMDTRYEVRDAQELVGILVDEGVADPTRIGATGASYGGGKAMALAALNDRVMLPNGSLTPWASPDGIPIRLAAAAPETSWTDLAYALLPNGHTLDYVSEAPYVARGRVGVMKLAFAARLYGAGLETRYYGVPDLDPEVDPSSSWFSLLIAGEPYEGNPLISYLVYQLTTHHSSYYIDDSRPPAPLLISSGWTDDLVPADEALRYYNRTRTNHPAAEISLLFLDLGHPRAQNKAADLATLGPRKLAWFEYYLKGEGPRPRLGVEALTQACGKPGAGPFTAPSWADIAPGEVRFSARGSKTILPRFGNLSVGQAYDPIVGGGACATASGRDQFGTASYRLPPAPPGGFTLLGSPTIVADIDSPEGNSQIAARLLDVGPDGATLIARGLYRPEISPGGEPTRQVFQLHPNGWRFEEGHIAKLELLSSDIPYARFSNGQSPITVSNLELRLPVLEEPDGGLVQEPVAKVVPDGYQLAIDFRDR